MIVVLISHNTTWYQEIKDAINLTKLFFKLKNCFNAVVRNNMSSVTIKILLYFPQ